MCLREDTVKWRRQGMGFLFVFFPLFWYLFSALVCHFQPFQEPFWGQSQARALAGLGSWEIPSKLNCRNIWCLHRVFPNNQTDSLLLYLTSSLTVLGHFYSRQEILTANSAYSFLLLFAEAARYGCKGTDQGTVPLCSIAHVLGTFWSAGKSSSFENYLFFQPLLSQRKGISSNSICLP